MSVWTTFYGVLIGWWQIRQRHFFMNRVLPITYLKWKSIITLQKRIDRIDHLYIARWPGSQLFIPRQCCVREPTFRSVFHALIARHLSLLAVSRPYAIHLRLQCNPCTEVHSLKAVNTVQIWMLCEASITAEQTTQTSFTLDVTGECPHEHSYCRKFIDFYTFLVYSELETLLDNFFGTMRMIFN